MSRSLLLKQYFTVFSRIGKNYDEKNNVLKQNRLEILLEQPKTKRCPEQGPSRKNNLLDSKQFEDLIRPEKPRKTAKSKFALNSPSFKAQSREEFYKANAMRGSGPQGALYNCNYNLTTKAAPVTDFKYRPPTQSKKKQNHSAAEPQLVNKPGPKTQLPLEFSKQLPRTFHYNEASEQRFSAFNDKPAVFSKIKRVSTPDFSRGNGHALPLKLCENSSNYKLSTNVPKTVNFSKFRARKPLVLDCMNDLVYDQVSHALTEKASPTFSIKKRLNVESSLPRHMLVSGSRTSLGTVTGATLRQNCYSSMGLASPSELNQFHIEEL